MGYIADMARNSTREAVERGRASWLQTFGTEKERVQRPAQPKETPDGGSWGRSLSGSSTASFKRLLEAMRSRAPGGWSDDRYAESQHYLSITYDAVHRMCEILSESEFQVFVKDPRHQDGKRPINEYDRPHRDRLVRPYDLVELLEKPNNDQSFGNIMEEYALQINLTGTSFNWVVPNVLGTPFEMYPIPTCIAIPQPVINPQYPHGFYRIQPIYPYGPFSSFPTPNSAVGAAIPAEWMIRTKFPHPILRYDGFSPMTAMRKHIDEVESIDDSRWYRMQRGSRPDAVLNPDEKENLDPIPGPEIDRIHAEWESNNQGPQNAGRLIVGTPGYKFEPWSGGSAVEMDYVNSWNQLVAFVMSGFGVTKSITGMTDDTSYANLFASLKQFHMLTLNPLCHRFATQLTKRIAPFFGDGLIIEIRCKRIDDHDVQNSKVTLLMQGKCITKNQMLKLLDEPTTSEGWGEEIAGTEPQPQMQGIPNAQAQAAPAMPQPMEQPQENGQQQQPQQDPLAPPQDQAVEQSRPRPGNLSAGSLGPRKDLLSALNGNGKHLKPKKKKSMYEAVMEVTANGKH